MFGTSNDDCEKCKTEVILAEHFMKRDATKAKFRMLFDRLCNMIPGIVDRCIANFDKTWNDTWPLINPTRVCELMKKC